MTNTVIGGSMKIDGELLSDADLLIQGTVKGRVVARGNLLVDKSGNVDASVEAENLEIAGLVTGNMVAEKKVEISAGGRAVGDVKAQRILIADGAVFKGNVDMSASSNATRR
jgi:cytoskeletal protein CcmA (bactofilin family)